MKKNEFILNHIAQMLKEFDRGKSVEELTGTMG
jgi:hypothetical protein